VLVAVPKLAAALAITPTPAHQTSGMVGVDTACIADSKPFFASNGEKADQVGTLGRYCFLAPVPSKKQVNYPSNVLSMCAALHGLVDHRVMPAGSSSTQGWCW